MKKSLRFFALLLCALMLASCGSNGEEAAPPPTSNGVANTPDTAAPALSEDGTVYINGINVTGMPEVELENKKLVIYCWGEYEPEKLFDWQGFRFVDYYGGEIEIILSSGDYYQNLYKLVAAGDIPDIVIGEAKSFPAMIMRDLVQPWDDYIDYDDPIWDYTGARADIEAMRWNGEIYNMTARAHLLGVMFYNKRLVEESGLDDPMELQERGEWTWETFKRYIDECTVDLDGDGVIDVYGMVNTGDFPLSLIASTGETHIEFNGETFVNNITSAKVADAANLLYSIGPGGQGFLNLGDPIGEFRNGRAAFVYTNDYRGYIDYADMWGTDGIGIVPMPAYEGADAQYQAALTDHLWLMKGANNPEAAALMVLAERYDQLLNVDPKAGSAEETQIRTWEARGFTREAAEAVVKIQQMPTKVLFSRCVTLSDGALEYRALDEPWTTLRDSASGSVERAISEAMTPVSE